MEKTAQRFLLYAIIRDPRLANEQAGVLFEELAKFSNNKHNIADADQFIDYVLSHLPPPLQHLAGRVEEVRKLIPSINHDVILRLDT